jgi:hypothetical protein
MKAIVLHPFTDKESGKAHFPGAKFDVTEARFDEINDIIQKAHGRPALKWVEETNAEETAVTNEAEAPAEEKAKKTMKKQAKKAK